MSNQDKNNPEHDEFFSMLPWYINNTLEQSQRAAVSQHLSHCDECQHEAQLLTALNETVQSDAGNQYFRHADVEKNLADVMSQIDSDAMKVDAVESWSSGLKQKLKSMFSFPGSLSNAQWGATALAGLLAVVLGMQFYNEQSNDDYSVLSSSAIEDSSMRLSVEITSDADMDQVQSAIRSELNKRGQRIDINTNADGIVVVVLKDSVGVRELSEIIIDLENEVTIKRVELLP